MLGLFSKIALPFLKGGLYQKEKVGFLLTIPPGGRGGQRGRKGEDCFFENCLHFVKDDLYREERDRIIVKNTRSRAGGSKAEMGKHAPPF